MTLQQEIKVIELRTHKCKRGHSKQDAYLFIHPFTQAIRMNCKSCAALRYTKVIVNKSLKHGLYAGDKKNKSYRPKRKLELINGH